jgi:hypothetical protein
MDSTYFWFAVGCLENLILQLVVGQLNTRKPLLLLGLRFFNIINPISSRVSANYVENMIG